MYLYLFQPLYITVKTVIVSFHVCFFYIAIIHTRFYNKHDIIYTSPLYTHQLVFSVLLKVFLAWYMLSSHVSALLALSREVGVRVGLLVMVQIELLLLQINIQSCRTD